MDNDKPRPSVGFFLPELAALLLAEGDKGKMVNQLSGQLRKR